MRLARAADAEAIGELTTQLGYDVASSEVEERLPHILSRPDHRFLVAESNGQPVGWLHAAIAEFIETEPFVMIAGLVVDRHHRRTGVGRILMEQAEAWARQQGCSIVRLWSSSTRTNAHSFYERLGYSKIKTQYSFAKPLEGERQARLDRFVPRVDE